MVREGLVFLELLESDGDDRLELLETDGDECFAMCGLVLVLVF